MQLSPCHPGMQRQVPVTELHSPPFWHLHFCEQSWPHVFSGQDSLQRSPMYPGLQWHLPVMWLQGRPSPCTHSGHTSEQFWPKEPAGHGSLQSLPVQPRSHTQTPVSGSQDELFLQSHVFSHDAPHCPRVHWLSHDTPLMPGAQLHFPVTWSHPRECSQLHLHFFSQLSPYFP